VQRLYDAMLAVRGGEADGEELHAPRLRLRLLRSLHWLASRASQRLRERQPALSYMAYRSGVAREVSQALRPNLFPCEGPSTIITYQVLSASSHLDASECFMLAISGGLLFMCQCWVS
jgi:hypothetical protein